MKKLFISFIAMLSVVFFFVSGKGYAEEVKLNTPMTEEESKLVEPFVELVDGFYKLKADNPLSEELKNKANLVIDNTNLALKKIDKSYLYVDYRTKTVKTYGLLDRALGKNDVEFYWNFARVYVDANNLNMLFQGILAGGTLYLTSQFPFGARQIEALSEMVGYKIEFRDGIWFDLNYLGIITQLGWQ